MLSLSGLVLIFGLFLDRVCVFQGSLEHLMIFLLDLPRAGIVDVRPNAWLDFSPLIMFAWGTGK